MSRSTETFNDRLLIEEPNWSVEWHGWVNNHRLPPLPSSSDLTSSSSHCSVNPSWLVNINACASEECLSIEILNSHYQCRAYSDFNVRDLVKLGMPSKMDLEELSEMIIGLCKSETNGDTNIEITDDIKSLSSKKNISIQINGTVPNLHDSNIGYDPTTDHAADTDEKRGPIYETNALVSPVVYVFPLKMMPYDVRKDGERIRLRSELHCKNETIKVLKTSNHQWKEDLVRYESEIEILAKDVDRLTNGLSEEVLKNEFHFQNYKELIDLFGKSKRWDHNLDLTERDVNGEALFLVKLRQFARESHDVLDLLHVKYLLLNSDTEFDTNINEERYGTENKNALHLCAQYPCLSDMLRWIMTIDHEIWMMIDPNVTDAKQMTPLNLASYNGNIAAVELLLKHPMIDAHKGDKGGFMPLHWAAYQNHPEVVTALLEHGCDSDQTNNDGLMALDLARRESSDPVVDILRRHSTQKSLRNLESSFSIE